MSASVRRPPLRGRDRTGRQTDEGGEPSAVRRAEVERHIHVGVEREAWRREARFEGPARGGSLRGQAVARRAGGELDGGLRRLQRRNAVGQRVRRRAGAVDRAGEGDEPVEPLRVDIEGEPPFRPLSARADAPLSRKFRAAGVGHGEPPDFEAVRIQRSVQSDVSQRNAEQRQGLRVEGHGDVGVGAADHPGDEPVRAERVEIELVGREPRFQGRALAILRRAPRETPRRHRAVAFDPRVVDRQSAHPRADVALDGQAANGCPRALPRAALQPAAKAREVGGREIDLAGKTRLSVHEHKRAGRREPRVARKADRRARDPPDVVVRDQLCGQIAGDIAGEHDPADVDGDAPRQQRPRGAGELSRDLFDHAERRLGTVGAGEAVEVELARPERQVHARRCAETEGALPGEPKAALIRAVGRVDRIEGEPRGVARDLRREPPRRRVDLRLTLF